MAKFYVVTQPVIFHGFTFRPGYVWGRETSGGEFAASGWRNDDELYIYRRQSDGSWIGNWEQSVPNYLPRLKGPAFWPASEAAQIVAYCMGDD